MKRVIVTGSKGLIGKEVSNFLEQTDYKIINGLKCKKLISCTLIKTLS